MTKVKNFFLSIIPSKRKLIQLYSALLHNAHIKGFVTGEIFTGSLKNVCAPGFNCYSCPGAIAACPLGSIQNALAESKTKTPTYVFGIILLYCIILGRTICGYLCPAGLLQELLYKIKTPKLKKSKVTRALSYFKYVILFILVIGVPLMYALQKNNMPVPAFCKYICPVGTFEGGIFLLIPQSNSDYYAMLGALFSWKFLIMLLIILSSIFIYRVFCRFLCPLGAIYGLFNKLSIIGVKVDKAKCTNCHACVNVCKMDVKEVGDHECINCGECIDVCKADAIKWKNVLNLIRREKELEASFATEGGALDVIEDNKVDINNISTTATTTSNVAENNDENNVKEEKKKINKSLVTRIVLSVGLIAILITTLVLVNVDFSKKIYSQNMILDSFNTKLYNGDEYDINNSDKDAKLIYFYDDFDNDLFNEINSITADNLDVVLISKYDDKDNYNNLVNDNFNNSNILFGYDSVNQTEINKFVETISYPYIVILDKDNKIVLAEQNSYNESYYNDYINPLINDIIIGNEVGNKCLIQDLTFMTDGSKFNISKYLGKIVILNFWYLGCTPCQNEMPYFSDVNNEYDEVEVISVSENLAYILDPEGTLAYYSEQNLNLIPAYESTGNPYATALFGVAQQFPMTIIIDQEGFIAYKCIGELEEAELRAQVEALLS